MTTTHNGQQDIPLRPLFRNNADEALSPADQPRRVTLPTQYPPHHKRTTYNCCTKRYHTNTRKRRSSTSPDLDQQFADGIKDIRREIRKAADDVLTDVEGDAIIELGHAVGELEEKLQLELGYERRAFQSIADERLLVTKLSPEKEVVKKEEVVFRNRMQIFQQIVEEEEKVLELLWQEWTKIQTDTICLAFEVLGPHEVAIKEEEEDLSVVVLDKIGEAIQRYAQYHDALNGALDQMAAIQNSVKKVTSRTLKTLRDQQEELSAANKATMKCMAKMLEELNP